MTEVHYIFRRLFRSPGFSLIALATIVLGAGSVTAVLSVTYAVLLRELPYPEAKKLVVIESVSDREQNAPTGVSPADVLDWEREESVFTAVAGVSGGSISIADKDRPEFLYGARVTSRFFDVFAVHPLLGRTFAREDASSASTKSIVISHALWENRFAADPGVVGRVLPIDGSPTVILGVMPKTFRYPPYAEAWIPLASDSSEFRNRANRYFQVVAREKPEVAREAVQAQTRAAAARLALDHPAQNEGWGARVRPLRDVVVGDTGRALRLLACAASLMAIIASCSLAGLFLVRALSRQREASIRLALGATDWSVAKPLAGEALALAFIGAMVAWLAAILVCQSLPALLPQNSTFLFVDLSPGPFLPLVAFGGATASALVAVLAPLLWLRRRQPASTLKHDQRSAGSPWIWKVQSGLVMWQVALSFVLVIGTSVLISNLHRLLKLNPGYEPDRLAAASIGLPAQGPAAFAQQLIERVSALPQGQCVRGRKSLMF